MMEKSMFIHADMSIHHYLYAVTFCDSRFYDVQGAGSRGVSNAMINEGHFDFN